VIAVQTSIASFPGPRRRGERAWFPLFAHALNCGGIPPEPRTFDSWPYPCACCGSPMCVHSLKVWQIATQWIWIGCSVTC